MSAQVWRRDGAYEWRGKRLDSVTAILGTLGKGALIQWAADQAADAAIALAESSAPLDRDVIRKAHLRTRNAAGDRGTSIHEIADTLAAGGTVAREAVPELLRGHFDGLTAFLAEHRVETLWSERTVASEYGYAGTLDRLARLDGELRVLDFKTRADAGKATLYPETRMQAVAYARADVALNLDGTEEPLPAGIVGGACVSLYPTGTTITDDKGVARAGYYKLDLIDDPDGATFGAFLSLLAVHRWARSVAPEKGKRT